jgi:hypothetical protein
VLNTMRPSTSTSGSSASRRSVLKGLRGRVSAVSPVVPPARRRTASATGFGLPHLPITVKGRLSAGAPRSASRRLLQPPFTRRLPGRYQCSGVPSTPRTPGTTPTGP